MKCPRDQSQLVDRFIIGKLTYRCPKCDGVFVGRDTLRRLYDLISSPGPRILASPDMDEPALLASGILCPYDGKPMGLRTYMAVRLDVCSRCLGVWFDQGELEQVWAEYKEGSGPEVRAKEQEKQPFSLKEALLVFPETVKLVVDGILEFVGDIVQARYRQ